MWSGEEFYEQGGKVIILEGSLLVMAKQNGDGVLYPVL